MSYDASLASSLNPTNHPTTGLSSVTTSGADFGTADHSPASRYGGSAALRTLWTSDTSVICQMPAGAGADYRVVVTAGRSLATLLHAVSYNLPSVSAVPDRALSGGTQCATTNGQTCTCTGIMTTASISGSPSDVSGSATCTTAPCYCYASPFAYGQIATIFGQDFGLADNSPQVTVGGVSAEYTQWISQSTVQCKLPSCADCTTSSSHVYVVQVASQSSTSYNRADSYTFS